MKAFPWRAGMRAIDKNGKGWRLFNGSDGVLRAQGEPDGYCGGWLSTAPLLEARPDPNDGATKGGFLEAVREVYNDPHIGVSYETWIDGQNYWRVGLDYEHPCGRAELGTDPDSEFAALEAAWKAAP